MINQEIISAAREIIGRHLKQTREEKGLSRSAVARLAGLTHDQVRDFESGEKSYTIDTFLRMCHALDLYFYMADKPEGQQGHDLDDLMRKGAENYPK